MVHYREKLRRKEVVNMLGENDCVWCGMKLKNKEEHDKHYKKCTEENVKDDYSKEEAFDLIHNKNNY